MLICHLGVKKDGLLILQLNIFDALREMIHEKVHAILTSKGTLQIFSYIICN